MKKTLTYLFLLMVLVACNSEEEDLQNVFRYKNNTSYQVKVIVYGEGISQTGNHATDTINISSSDISEMSYVCVGDFCKGVSNEPFRGLADSAKIIFNGDRQLLFLSGQNCSANILCRDAYAKEREGDNMVLQYIIGEDLYGQSQ
ncbi:MAG: hypothetical protein ACK5HT_13595 [Draconibacterium sp.]